MTRESKMREFGAQLYEARKKYAQDNPDKRATQVAIGFLIGVTGTTISSWERGATFPSKANYEKLVELFPWLDTKPYRKLISAKTASSAGPKNPRSNKDMRQKSNGKRHTVEPMPAGATSKVSTDAEQPVEIQFMGWSLARLRDEEEPRIPDFIEAERLGFEEPRAIRKLIKRNEEELKRYGQLVTRDTVSRIARQSRGEVEIESEVYYLNEDQALLVAMLSRTAKAVDIRYEIIQVYKAWKKGLAQPGRPIDLAVSQSYAMLSEKLELAVTTLADSFESKLDAFMDVMDRGLTEVTSRLEKVGQETKAVNDEVIREHVVQARADQNGWAHQGEGKWAHKDGRRAVGANVMLNTLKGDPVLITALQASQKLSNEEVPQFPALNQLNWIAELAGIHREPLNRADLKEGDNVVHQAYPDPDYDRAAYVALRSAVSVWGYYGGPKFIEIPGFGHYFNLLDATKKLSQTFGVASLDSRLSYANNQAKIHLKKRPT
jgi:transcriptional regulator with XRE-family HTH domain